jgi:membrane-associated phospholipid phosphatase
MHHNTISGSLQAESDSRRPGRPGRDAPQRSAATHPSSLYLHSDALLFVVVALTSWRVKNVIPDWPCARRTPCFMLELPTHLWLSITRFGGAGLTLPLAIAIALWLALGYTWRLAAAWLGLLGAAVGVVALTKIAFLGWGVGVRELDFTGVSGHAMLSTAVYPVALFLMLMPTRAPVRLAGVALGLAAGLAVGLSRVVLDAHSPSEAVAGCVVGAFAAVLFVWWSWDAKPGELHAVPIAVSFLMLTVALHDVRVPTQRWITHIALHLSGHERPFIRARWKAGRDNPRPGAMAPQGRPVTNPTSAA